MKIIALSLFGLGIFLSFTGVNYLFVISAFAGGILFATLQKKKKEI